MSRQKSLDGIASQTGQHRGGQEALSLKVGAGEASQGQRGIPQSPKVALKGFRL